MAGTSTIPTIASGATKTQLSISWVDNENRSYSDSINIDPDPADADVQALVVASQNASNASSWKLEVTKVYEGIKNAGAAAQDPYESVNDKVRLSFKDLSNDAYQQAYIPAPLTDMVEDGGVVVNTDAEYIAWKNAVIALIQNGFDPLNAEFVEYSQRNQKVAP